MKIDDWENLCAIAAEEVGLTVKKLPELLSERTKKLPVAFERRPNEDLRADGIEPDTLGLFIGAEFVEENDLPLPPQNLISEKHLGHGRSERETFS